jgi:uncharacterized protein
MGIDLAGSPKRNTGICVLAGSRILHVATVFSDEDIKAVVDQWSPDLIAVDAPLNLPPGRKTLDDRNGEHFRPCDRELLKRGIRFFPITLGPMRSLTLRGIALARRYRRRRIEVIEIYPGAAQDIWKIPRKQFGLPKLRRGMETLGTIGLHPGLNGDELDAVSAAMVGRDYLAGKTELIGHRTQGAIILPLPPQTKQLRNKK